MDIVQLLQEVELRDVRLIGRDSRLKLDPRKGVSSLVVDSDEDAEMSIDINAVSWGERIEVWFRIRVEDPRALVSADVAVLYDRGSEEEVPESVRVEFIEKVAVMSAYPYLRQEAQTLAADLRLGHVTLPIMRQGEFRIRSPQSEPEPSREAQDER